MFIGISYNKAYYYWHQPKQSILLLALTKREHINSQSEQCNLSQSTEKCTNESKWLNKPLIQQNIIILYGLSCIIYTVFTYLHDDKYPLLYCHRYPIKGVDEGTSCRDIQVRDFRSGPNISKWKKSGSYQNQYSVYFGSVTQNVLKMHLKMSLIFPVW